MVKTGKNLKNPLFLEKNTFLMKNIEISPSVFVCENAVFVVIYEPIDLKFG